jgi:ketosteroid isomerase-like protein
MSDKSANGVVFVTFVLIALLLLLVGGVGFYHFFVRPQMELATAKRARAVEALTRMQRQLAQAKTEANAASRASADESESSPQRNDAIRADVESVLRTQEEAWNRGDVDAFMEHYWKSDDLTFSSGGKTTRGWNATRDRYREKYPTREKMGRVGFSGLEITPLGDSAALVLGEWKLDRESEPLSGNFSIVFRKLDGRWVVAHDHTSLLAEQ